MQPLTVAAVLVFLINGICVFAAGYTQARYWYYAMFAIATTGLSTFFGIVIQDLRSGTETRVSNQTMRLAVAGLITSTYTVLLAYLLFIPKDFELAPAANSLLTNFTTVVGVVIAFFFGSSAYVEARSRQTKKKETEGDGD